MLNLTKTNLLFYPDKDCDIPECRTANTVTDSPLCARTIFEAVLGTNNTFMPSREMMQFRSKGNFRIIPITKDYMKSVNGEDSEEKRIAYAEQLSEEAAFECMKHYELCYNDAVVYFVIDLYSHSYTLSEVMPQLLPPIEERDELKYELAKIFRTGQVFVPGIYVNAFDLESLDLQLRSNTRAMFDMDNIPIKTMQEYGDEHSATLFYPVIIRTTLESSVLTEEDLNGTGRYSFKTIHPADMDVTPATEILLRHLMNATKGKLNIGVATTMVTAGDILGHMASDFEIPREIEE